jgi:murein DD-endopeptidase MepM/ murein hydrolase activator NlpD
MSLVAELLCSRRVPLVAALALISFAFAGCSSDTSTRFSQTTLGNPFNYQPEATGSVPSAAPTPQVERRPYGSAASGAPPLVAAPQSYPSASPGVSGGGRGMASYAPPVNSYAPTAPPAPPKLETTGAVAPRSVAVARPAHMKIIVGTSDTLEVLARRYHVTPAAILAANGYKGPRTLSPGQSLLIPQPGAAPVAAAAPVAPAPAVAAAPAAPLLTRPVAVAAAPAPAGVHVVNKGDTLHSIAHRYHVSVAELARANNLDSGVKLKLGTRLTVPARAAAAAAPVAPLAAPQPLAAAPVAPAPKFASAAPAAQQSARLAQAGPAAEEGAPESAVKAEATGAVPTFRWPVRGKVIASYGAKTNGKSNDGINLAVPEGTPVKAAEDGVVAYAGNELKGYGNLVLVRHSNGYVTAYAHASELLVKRGDTIKRGQVIAKSGQSGEVASPQLHFEIRKGPSPVDPLQFLNGA